MKIWIRKSNFRLELMIVKRFSVLQDLSTNLRMNALFKSNDIHASKIDLSNNIKKNNKKSNETFSKKDYLFEKEHNPNDLIDIKYIQIFHNLADLFIYLKKMITIQLIIITS